MFLRVNILVLFVLLLVGCYEEVVPDGSGSEGSGSSSQLVLTIINPVSEGTRAATEDPDGYEVGIEWENSIDIAGGDYRLYFFSYESGDSNGGRLLVDFTPDRVYSSSTSSSTTYTIVGSVPNAIKDLGSFRVVMLANWGTYPSVVVGETTIDELVEGASSTFSAANKFSLSDEALVPFYGVQEYEGISFATGTTTTLPTPVSLLRAVAKVEVIMRANSEVEAFDEVSIVNYNSQGYCAPAGVYTYADYDTQMSKNPSTSEWADEWVSSLHLLNNANDVGSKTQAFTHVSGTTLDTWRIYVPEYNNMGEDFSYIRVSFDSEEHTIYFAEYDEEGLTDNEEVSNRYNLKRNNIYRFYVTHNPFDFFVEAEVFPWVERLDNVEF